MLRFTTSLLAEVNERPMDVSEISGKLALMQALHLVTKYSTPGDPLFGIARARQLCLSAPECQLCTDAQGEISPEGA